MQYINIGNKNLQSGYSTYVLQHNGNDIRFFAYSGDRAIGANKQGQELNAYMGRYFLRKGFSDIINCLDTNVVMPQYVDEKGNDYYPQQQEDVISLICEDKIGIKGFTFSPTATKEQKEEAFGNVIDRFVATSRNEDFKSDTNLFLVQTSFYKVAYNNGGSETMRINGVDVKEKLGLNTTDVVAREKIRNRLHGSAGR